MATHRPPPLSRRRCWLCARSRRTGRWPGAMSALCAPLPGAWCSACMCGASSSFVVHPQHATHSPVSCCAVASDPSIKRSICKHCDALLVPGISARVRIKSTRGVGEGWWLQFSMSSLTSSTHPSPPRPSPPLPPDKSGRRAVISCIDCGTCKNYGLDKDERWADGDVAATEVVAGKNPTGSRKRSSAALS